MEDSKKEIAPEVSVQKQKIVKPLNNVNFEETLVKAIGKATSSSLK